METDVSPIHPKLFDFVYTNKDEIESKLVQETLASMQMAEDSGLIRSDEKIRLHNEFVLLSIRRSFSWSNYLNK